MGMTETYQLFKYDTCPFCLRVRRFLEQSGIEIEMRDIYQEDGAMRELVQGGGRSTVPCLRIQRGDEVEWMYESLDIMRYLSANASPA